LLYSKQLRKLNTETSIWTDANERKTVSNQFKVTGQR
jgi:hypothetical protein